MVDCKKCDKFRDDVSILIIDIESVNPLDYNITHFENGYGCIYNGIESLYIGALQKGSCRCRGD